MKPGTTVPAGEHVRREKESSLGVRSGADYATALRDGREVWHAGKRIDDVTKHPGFAGSVQTLAELYDKQRSPEYADIMTVEHAGSRMSYSYLPPATMEQLLAKRRNIEFWSDQTFGLMGRFPEFCAELVVGLLDFAGTLDRKDVRWGANARNYYAHCMSGDLCLTHALNDQFYDRAKHAGDQDDPDLILHVVRETAQGPIVRGLRVLATLAPLSDEVLVHPNRPREADELDFALAFAIPINAPGLKIVCRDLYAEHADRERLPLTARYDEVDAALIFEDVLIPWERLFVYRDVQLAAMFHAGIQRWASYSTMVRLIVKLESFLGVTQILTQYANRLTTPAAQSLLANFMQDIQVLRACVQAAEANAVRTQSGLLAPLVTNGYRLAGIEASDRADRTMQDLLTSYLIATGGVSDLRSPGIGSQVERYFRGGASSTTEHLRLIAIAADMVMSPFGARNNLYERLQSGEPDAIRRRLFTEFKDTAGIDRVRRFVTSMETSPHS
jgi:aromatic ring hydroxylase